ncbi:juvenile hormone epoxide hydrolase 1-like [Anoplophora glabripennis]|uniref:juvenile hormone epoxide hydrolase 1-like n=1 Tax=Anoplophora glabripennis TaxID=217634 RepID=UPI000874683E|nr:juvenile hormone epoxide hydrolase 1-like [Anoplophora glabripennis]
MGLKRVLVTWSIAIVLVAVYMKGKVLFEVPPLPQLEETWWGPRDPSKGDTEIRPFKINVSDEALKDLQRRLANALPFQEPLEDVKQHYGMNANLLKNIVDFWRTKYDWREREKFLNQYPQFTVSVQGLRIHYLHVKPKETKGVKVLPLLLLHDWPGSIREFYEMIPLLTTPQKGRDFVFEVIAPSMPVKFPSL